jgi:hypothetical protein
MKSSSERTFPSARRSSADASRSKLLPLVVSGSRPSRHQPCQAQDRSQPERLLPLVSVSPSIACFPRVRVLTCQGRPTTQGFLHMLGQRHANLRLCLACGIPSFFRDSPYTRSMTVARSHATPGGVLTRGRQPAALSPPAQRAAAKKLILTGSPVRTARPASGLRTSSAGDSRPSPSARSG